MISTINLAARNLTAWTRGPRPRVPTVSAVAAVVRTVGRRHRAHRPPAQPPRPPKAHVPQHLCGLGAAPAALGAHGDDALLHLRRLFRLRRPCGPRAVSRTALRTSGDLRRFEFRAHDQGSGYLWVKGPP